jgi:hypothetical protein
MCGIVGGTTSEDLFFSIRGISHIDGDAIAVATLNARIAGVGGLEFHAEIADKGLSDGSHLRGLDGLKGRAVALLDPIGSVMEIKVSQVARTFFTRFEALEVLSFIFR